MKIIILGAGQVGATLAEHLADEKNDITVIDEHAATLKRLQERLDLRTCLLYTSPSPRDRTRSRMPSSA